MGEKGITGAGFGIMILNQERKVLLGRRHSDPEKADSELHGEGTWTMPGGKLIFGETFHQATFREVLEETGLRINGVKLISLTDDIVHDAHFITGGFICENFEGEPQVLEPDEIVEWKWFDLTDLPKPLFFPSKKIFKNYFDKEVYKH